MHEQMMKVFKPTEENEALQKKINEMQIEHVHEVQELNAAIDKLRELETYKEQYFGLKKIFDDLEKSHSYKDKDMEFVRREYELKLTSLETHKDNEYRVLSQEYSELQQRFSNLEETIERARNSGICVDPENCRVVDCPCKYDISKLLEDNQTLQQDNESLQDEKHELENLILERDEEIGRLDNVIKQLTIQLNEAKEKHDDTQTRLDLNSKELKKICEDNSKLQRRVINLLHSVKIQKNTSQVQ